jgi:hypothetical protein
MTGLQLYRIRWRHYLLVAALGAMTACGSSTQSTPGPPVSAAVPASPKSKVMIKWRGLDSRYEADEEVQEKP